MQHFTSAIGQHASMANFIAAMERMTLQPGQVLIKAGEATSDVYFIETGRLEVQLDLKEGNTIRLSALTDGAIVGEIALYLENKRTADVVAKTNCTLYKLSPEKLATLEKEDPKLALLAHRLMASNLSQKMIRANRMIQSQS